MSEWKGPNPTGDANEFVERLRRQIAAFAEASGVAQPVIQVELRDHLRARVESFSAEPGVGFITIYLRPGEDLPAALIVPVSAVARIELFATEEREPSFGFTLTQ